MVYMCSMQKKWQYVGSLENKSLCQKKLINGEPEKLAPLKYISEAAEHLQISECMCIYG